MREALHASHAVGPGGAEEKDGRRVGHRGGRQCPATHELYRILIEIALL